MTLRIKYTARTSIPVEVEGLVPDVLRPMSLDEIRRIDVFHGNQKTALGELFEVSGDASDERMEWEGDLNGVHWIGAKMSSGIVRVIGSAGRHVGSEMVGGEIHVDGDAGDWVGGEMRGGMIHVRGSAGHLVGAAYRGSQRGMTGGTILIGRDVGNEVGHTMRRGLLVVSGNAGDLVGFNMIAGTILIFGNCGIRNGAGMRRGTIGLFGADPPELLPSFRIGCRYQPGVLRLLLQEIEQHGFKVPEELLTCDYQNYHGDLIEGGKGEIFVRALIQ